MNINHWLSYPDEQVLILAKSQSITVGQMRGYVAHTQQQLMTLHPLSCALYSNNLLEFVVIFLACAHAGINLVLPANNLPEMTQNLDVDCFMGDWPNPAFSVDLQHNHESAEIHIGQQQSKVTLFTSGSTGLPKSISRDLIQLLGEVDVLNHTFVNESEPLLFVATVSQQHIYGLLFTVLWPILKGHVIWHKLILFEEMVDDINRLHRPWLLVSSPAFLKRLQETQQANNQLQQVFSSGGVLKDQQQAQAEKLLSAPVIQVYGSSETGGMAYRRFQHNWQFFDQVMHKIDDAGLLWVNSPFCYQPGWLCTQDLVELTKSGFKLLGRNDRIVKIEEKRVSLHAIEHAVSKLDCVTDVAALVVEQGRQYIALVIEINQQGIDFIAQYGEIELKKLIKETLTDSIEKIALPRKVRLVTEPLVNTQGKKVYSELVKLLA